MELLRKVRDSKFVRFLVRFSLAITAIEIAILLYFYDLPELWETYLRLTGLDKYIH